MSNPPENTPTSEKEGRDYRATLFLPATDFPMKAGLPEAEPKWLARWAAMDLYGKIREKARGRKLFVLHDGPIYANGDIHSGTGLNHILKDFVVRSQGMLGMDAPYVPGWDCHGLPIEWKVEEQYRAEGKAKDDVAKDVLRRDCRVFAGHWLNVQREQIRRLGQIGDFERPYTTMNFKAEAVIAREAMKFVENGLLYRGFRPVMWSPVEKTALADAEVEYHEKSSPAIYVKFPIKFARQLRPAGHEEIPAEKAGLSHTFVVIWTTTPWTIPGNRAVAFSHGISYGLYQVSDATDGSLARASENLILADDLAEQVAKQAKMVISRVRDVHGTELQTFVLAHPLRSLGYDFDVPLLPGAHVTADTRHRLCPYRPRPWRRRFRIDDVEFPRLCRVQSRRVQPDPAGWQLFAERAGVCRQAHPDAGRQGRRRQWRGDQGIDCAWQASGQGQPAPFLSP